MALTAQQMAAMSRLLDEALELDAAGRQRWLQTLDPRHRELEPALRQALLGEPEGLETSASLNPKMPTFAGQPAPGAVVGPYRLVRPLGTGGMAQVWLAQRADGAYKREVALKLPATAMRQDLASRFARERDILAQLEHPNIARLYDAGFSAEGHPYLTMEYVSGRPLIGWCDAHRLAVPERLQLFRQVLDAVQYAHERQVIHRDLKPSNILVTEAGQVRLLDFGVAKLLAPDQDSTELTQLYGQALTPQYSSPEQLRGDTADGASDVYSLGVLLFELLAGTLPYKLKAGASAGLLEQAVLTAPVQRPSACIDEAAAAARATSARELARMLQGDLDQIVLKALAKDPAQRYGSAHALAEDLRRKLAGEPAQARSGSLLGRLSRQMFKRRTASAAGIAATVPVAATAGRPGTGRNETPSKRIAGEAPAPAVPSAHAATTPTGDKSIAVLPFVDMSEKRDQEYFSDGLTQELIDRLAQSAELRVISRTSSFYFKGKQVTSGEIARTLGVAHLLEGSVRKAGEDLRITAQLIRAADGSHLWSQTYERRLADVFKVQSDIATTVAQALKVALNTTGSGATRERNIDAHNLVMQGEFLQKLRTRSDLEKAVGLYKRALQIDPQDKVALLKLARAHMDQGSNGWIRPSDVSALARGYLASALQIDPEFGAAYRTLGDIYLSFEINVPAARVQLLRAIELDPKDEAAKLALAWGEVLKHRQFQQYIDDQRRQLSRDPLDTFGLARLGYALFAAGRTPEAEDAWRSLEELNPNHAGGHCWWAMAQVLDGRPDEALATTQKELDEAWRLCVSPMVYWALGRKAESDAELARLKQKYADGSSYNVAEMHAYRGEIDAASEWLERAYERRDGGISYMKIDPILHNLRGDPRFQAMLVRTHLADL